MKKTIYTESFINLYEAKNAKRVFDSIFVFWQERDLSGAWRRGGFTQYSDIAEDILRIVMKYGEGFVVDICDKALNKAWELSDRQRWCVAFAFIKISEDQIEEYAAEVEAMMAEAEEAEASENAESKEADVEAKAESVESVAAEAIAEAPKTLPAVSKKSRKSQPKSPKSMKSTKSTKRMRTYLFFPDIEILAQNKDAAIKQCMEILNKSGKRCDYKTCQALYWDAKLPKININDILQRVRDGHPIIDLRLKDASRYIANAMGEFYVDTTGFFSAKICAYHYPDDEIVAFGKKKFNVSELRRVLEDFRGKGAVSMWDGGPHPIYGVIA